MRGTWYAVTSILIAACSPKADIVVQGGPVWTGLSTGRGQRGAVAIAGGKILAVGDSAEIARYIATGEPMDKVPEIARRYGMTVSLGIWISPDMEKNEQQIELGIRTALANRRTIDRVIVGNETQLFGYVSPDQLNSYIQRVREALNQRRDGRGQITPSAASAAITCGE